jgi:hypothetical protein
VEQYCTHTFRRIVSTHNWKNDSPVKTYWLECKCCGHKWTVHYDRELKREVIVDKDSISRPLTVKKLTPEDVKLILTDPRSGAELAKELGVTHQSVNQVRLGMTHRQLWPELERHIPAPRRRVRRAATPAQPSAIDCRNCVHWWQGRCDLDVPEAGDDFAAECPYFGSDT